MNLTGKQLIVQGIINGPAIPKVNIQQHGVDLNLIKVERVDGTNFEGVVYADDQLDKKTSLAQRYVEELREDLYGKYWYLPIGVYDLTFVQGCKIPKDLMMKVIHRSSLYRNGASIESPLFDAGFETDNIGTTMIVHTPIKIYYNARVAQIYSFKWNDVENLYNGQWQGDKQRTESSVIIK